VVRVQQLCESRRHKGSDVLTLASVLDSGRLLLLVPRFVALQAGLLRQDRLVLTSRRRRRYKPIVNPDFAQSPLIDLG
jgi:hypothetical protein